MRCFGEKMAERVLHTAYLVKSPPLNSVFATSFKRWRRRKFSLTSRALTYQTNRVCSVLFSLFGWRVCVPRQRPCLHPDLTLFGLQPTAQGLKEIPLSSITAINVCDHGKYEYMFSLSTTHHGNRVYFFSADCPSSRDVWISLLT